MFLRNRDHEEEGRILRAAFQPRIAAQRPENVITRQATPSETIIDSAGDLRLEVGANHRDEQVSFIVCSKALARRSPIFKTMLFGPFAESKPSADGEWVVHLPDDHPHGFRILMHIIHANFAGVPVTLDSDKLTGMRKSSEYDLLYEIARMTDKYDMVDVVRPWINTWNEKSHAFYATDAEAHFHGQLTWIAWVFGDERLLRAGLDAVAVRAWIFDQDDDIPNDEGSSVYPRAGQHKPNDNQLHGVCFTDCQGRCISLCGPGEKNAILDLLDFSGMAFPSPRYLTASCRSEAES